MSLQKRLLYGPQFTPDEQAFRDEVRSFLKAELPDDIARKVKAGLGLQADDYTRWQKILYKRGWAAPGLGRSSSVARIGDPSSCISMMRKPRRQARLARFLSVSRWSRRSSWRSAMQPSSSASCRASVGRGLVVPGLLRTWRWLRSRFAQDARRATGRLLHRQRSEDLEHARAVRQLDLLPGAH